MNTQSQVRITLGQLVASAMLLTAAAAFGADTVSDGGRSVTDGFGRSSAMPSGQGKALRSAGDIPGVQNVVGRGSPNPSGATAAGVARNGTDVGQLGRASGNIAAAGRHGNGTKTAGLTK